MRTLSARPAALWALTAAVMVACATPPHEYAWTPPASVLPADREACHARADRVAQQRFDNYSDTLELIGPFGGPFGGVALAKRAQVDREQSYASEMQACLQERGYVAPVRHPAVPAGLEHDMR
jgi:hypothetical protein